MGYVDAMGCPLGWMPGYDHEQGTFGWHTATRDDIAKSYKASHLNVANQKD